MGQWLQFVDSNKEIHRMPSVSSIYAIPYNDKDQVENHLIPFPNIDPQEAFYIVNPKGDLRSVRKDLTKILNI